MWALAKYFGVLAKHFDAHAKYWSVHIWCLLMKSIFYFLLICYYPNSLKLLKVEASATVSHVSQVHGSFCQLCPAFPQLIILAVSHPVHKLVLHIEIKIYQFELHHLHFQNSSFNWDNHIQNASWIYQKVQKN